MPCQGAANPDLQNTLHDALLGHPLNGTPLTFVVCIWVFWGPTYLDILTFYIGYASNTIQFMNFPLVEHVGIVWTTCTSSNHIGHVRQQSPNYEKMIMKSYFPLNPLKVGAATQQMVLGRFKKHVQVM